MKNKKGISLIVLIITIIVIIILAAAIILSISKNNPITNANKAVNENDFKTAQEAVVAWLGDRWVSDIDGDGIAGDEVGAMYSGTVEKDSKNNITVTLEGKEPYTIDLDLASLGLDSLNKVVIENNQVKSIKKGEVEYNGESTNKVDSKNVSAQEVKQNATKYYGQSVNYTASGVTDEVDNNWKIFYSDGDKIYLISSDYMPNKYLSGLGFSTVEDEPYDVWVTTNREDLVNKLKTDNSNFKDTSGYAEKAVLASTLEMFCDSWNDLYPTEKIYYQYVTSGYNAEGYLVGSSENPTKYFEDNMSSKTGYGNILYFPHLGGYNKCCSFWLSAISASTSNRIMKIQWDGMIAYGYNFDKYIGVRPVITLKSNISLGELVDAKYELVEN